MKKLKPEPKPKIIARHRITFASEQDSRLLAIAKLGGWNEAIRNDGVNLENGKMQYRLSKGMKYDPHVTVDARGKPVGYRRAWAKGLSPLFKTVKEDLVGILQQEIQRTMPGRIQRREAQFTKK